MSEMDPATWRRIAPLFDEASKLDAAERAAYLDRLEQSEPQLRRLLEELLAADARSGAFLEDSAEQHAEALLQSGATGRSAPPPSIPSYRIESELGRGGMGVVYLATRQGADFEQRVALKIVRPDLSSQEIQHRFARERRILAALDHPGIARLVDGGRTAEGVSYFAMEYVEGTPITQYADAQRLPVLARLRLFEQVCAAVDHAHQHFVVHRDLKPSNILVTADGLPKLLDFGIARLLDSETGGSVPPQPNLTRDASRLLTPEYAAPEQILGKPATAATDVYSLGVILFELLCGHHPYAQSQLTALERVLREEDSEWLPKALSRETRIRHADGREEVIDASKVSQARSATPRTLRKLLEGDLASIVAMALRRDVKDRYASPRELLEDLQRLRAGLPVQARRSNWRYRLGKSLRRHRVSVAAAALVLLSLGTGAIVALWQARAAERAAERAVQVKDFVVSMFLDADPNESLGEDWTASQLLERGAERLERELVAQPETRAELIATLGVIRLERGEYEPARGLLQRALALRDSLQRLDPQDVKGVLLPLANVETLTGNFVAADSLLQRADASLGAAAPSDARAVYYSSLSVLRRRQGNYEAAESVARQAIEASRRAHGTAHPQVASDLDNLGVVLSDQGRVAEAIELHREALAIRRAALGNLHPDVTTSLHNVANILQQSGEHEEAIALLQESIAQKRRLYAGRHPSLAESLRTLGSILRGQQRLDEAQSLFEEALAMDLELLGPTSEAVASDHNEMAVVAYLRNDLATAKQLFSQALAGFEQALAVGHAKTITVANNLATLEQVTGNLAGAETSYLHILELRRAALGDEHPDVAASHNSLGLTVRRLGRVDESIERHRSARAIYERFYEADHSEILRTDNYLASALSEAGQYDEALGLYRRVLKAYEAQFPDDHRDTADVRIGLGRLLHRMGRPAEGLPYLEAGETVRRQLFGHRGPATATAMMARGACLSDLGRYAEAETLLVLSHGVLERSLGASHPDTKSAATSLRELRRRTN